MILIPIFIHLIIMFLSKFFLSPELSLYPYLNSQGFLPYRDIIDQHFPIIFFGPFTLPQFLTSTPEKFLYLYLVITIVNDLLFYLNLVRYKAKHTIIFTAIFILASTIFANNVFWLETFLVLFLNIVLFLSQSKRSYSYFSLGFFVSLIILIKPTVTLAIICLLIFIKLKPNRFFIIGILMPLLINLLYLIKLNLLPDFIDLTLNFNRLYYLNNGFKYPEISSIIQIFIIVLPFYFIKLKNKLLIFITTFLFSFLVFPRFEYFHLLPAITILIFLTGISVKLNNQKIIYLILFLLIILNFRKLIHYSQGNYYFDDKTLATVEYLKNISGNTIYILGGNDLIYPLSQKIPPGYTYVPSLPWYLNVPKYQDKLIKALVRSPYTLILVNAEANVDNLAIVSPDMELMKFIKKNYTPFEKVGPYQVYKHKLFGNLEQ